MRPINDKREEMTEPADTRSDRAATTDPDPARIIERYIAGSDSERDEIAAEHPQLITSEITQRAERSRPGPQRTWTSIGAQYTTKKRRPDVLRAIASLEWQDITAGESMDAPASPGLAINACIRELRMPRVDQVAWHGLASTVDWRDRDKAEGEHYSIYGIQANYTNGRARVYVIDIGTATIPLASDFWPAPAKEKTAVSK